VPAAAVIPAPIVCMIYVAFKMSVVIIYVIKFRYLRFKFVNVYFFCVVANY